MSAKIGVIIVVCSLVMMCFLMVEAEIDCMGKDFFCATDNSYLSCFYDKDQNKNITVTDRITLCPTGISCDENSDECCEDPSFDCNGKAFYCLSIQSYAMCELRPDGTLRTIKSKYDCLPGLYCDQSSSGYECDSSTIPVDPSTKASTVTTETTTPETTTPETTTTETTTPETTTPETTTPETSTKETTTPETTTPETTTLETTTPETTTTETTTSETTTTETTTPETTTPETTTPETTTPRLIPAPPTVARLPPLPDFECTDSGIFPHPTDCHRYVRCNYVFDASRYENSQYYCVNELIFDPLLQKCTTNTKPCEDLLFKCVVSGWFADPSSPHKYINCVPKKDSTFYKVNYTCPGGKIFEVIAKACVEPNQDVEIETLSRRTLSLIQGDEGEEDEEFLEESDEMVADKIYFNSNEDASVNLHNDESYRFSLL